MKDDLLTMSISVFFQSSDKRGGWFSRMGRRRFGHPQIGFLFKTALKAAVCSAEEEVSSLTQTVVVVWTFLTEVDTGE